ncbi:MAG TPA: hexameric tyrosine-coordinated heme protein [Opitutaceae bacterium]
MPALSSSTIPSTLATATAAEGFSLARRLAETLVATVDPGAASAMPHLLRPQAANRPSVELVAAIYFHAIALANGGWRE